MSLTIEVEANPLLDLWVVLAELPMPLGQLQTTPAVIELLGSTAAAPMMADDELRQRVRSLLRAGGFKPTGRSKPASEFLRGAAADAPLRSINPAVDICNAVSLHSGLPISVVDAALLGPPLRVAVAAPDTRYVFNAAGQVIEVGGLLCLHDAEGPCANAVKDAQRTKTGADTVSTLSLVWGARAAPERAEMACRWYGQLLSELGIESRVTYPAST